MTRENKLRRCMEGTPVIAADVALRQTQRPWDAIAPEALAEVHAALDAWDGELGRD